MKLEKPHGEIKFQSKDFVEKVINNPEMQKTGYIKEFAMLTYSNIKQELMVELTMLLLSDEVIDEEG
jgi:ribosomal protein S8